MALTLDEKKGALKEFVRKAFLETGALCEFDTVDLLAAADAVDSWTETNQGSYNAALPDPFKSTASLEQKTLLLCFIALKRAGF